MQVQERICTFVAGQQLQQLYINTQIALPVETFVPPHFDPCTACLKVLYTSARCRLHMQSASLAQIAAIALPQQACIRPT